MIGFFRPPGGHENPRQYQEGDHAAAEADPYFRDSDTIRGMVTQHDVCQPDQRSDVHGAGG